MYTPSMPPHILLLSDMSADVSLLTIALEPEGYKVTSFLAKHTLDLETIATLAPLPDVIIHNLRRGQSLGAARRFLHDARRNPVVCRIPLILCTTASLEPELGKAQPGDAAPVRVTSAPPDIDVLLELLAEVATQRPQPAQAAPWNEIGIEDSPVG